MGATPLPGCVKLVVYNLSLDVTRKQVLELFQSYGRVRECDRITYKRNECAVAFAHLECSVDDLRNAIRDLRGKRVGQFRISVRVSIPNEEQHILTVENVGSDAREHDLEEHFAGIGELSYCEIMYDRHTDARLGHAAISFYTRAHAAEAMRRMTGTELRGRQILVRWLQSEDRHAASSNWYGLMLQLVPFGMSEKQLRALFSKCGPVREVDLEWSSNMGARRARIWFFRRADVLRAACHLNRRQYDSVQLRLSPLSELEQAAKKQSMCKSDPSGHKFGLCSSRRTMEIGATEASEQQPKGEGLSEEPFTSSAQTESGSAGFENAFREPVDDSAANSDQQSVKCLPESLVPREWMEPLSPSTRTLSPIFESELGSSDAEVEEILAGAIKTEAARHEEAPRGSPNLIDLETLADIGAFFHGASSRSTVDDATGVDVNNNVLEVITEKPPPTCTSCPPKAVQQEEGVHEPCAVVYAHQLDKLLDTSRRTLEHRFYDVPPRRRPFALVGILREVAVDSTKAPLRTLVIVGSADESQWLREHLIYSGIPSKPWNWENWWNEGMEAGVAYVSERAELTASVFLALDHVITMYTSANLGELHSTARSSGAQRCARPLLMTTFVDARDLYELSVAENVVQHARL